MTRPDRLVVVAGTATEIGKTWVTARIARSLRHDGISVSARKPAQSLEAGDGPSDAEVLAEATGEHPDEVCPARFTYLVPMAPPMAAAALDLPVPDLDDLVGDLRWATDTEVGLVETAGGVASPQAGDGDVTSLVARLRPDAVLLVADAGLGTIHAVRSALAVLAPGSPPVHVVLNRFDATDDLHRRNRAWLLDHDGIAAAVDVAGAVRLVLGP